MSVSSLILTFNPLVSSPKRKPSANAVVVSIKNIIPAINNFLILFSFLLSYCSCFLLLASCFLFFPMSLLVLLQGKVRFEDDRLAIGAESYACHRTLTQLSGRFKFLLCLWRDKDIDPFSLSDLIIGIGRYLPRFELAAVEFKILHGRLCRGPGLTGRGAARKTHDAHDQEGAENQCPSIRSFASFVTPHPFLTSFLFFLSNKYTLFRWQKYSGNVKIVLQRQVISRSCYRHRGRHC